LTAWRFGGTGFWQPCRGCAGELLGRERAARKARLGLWADPYYQDITVTVPKRNERTFAAAGLDLKNLAGRRIRVRGGIEQRCSEDRAFLAAKRPEQIESTNGE